MLASKSPEAVLNVYEYIEKNSVIRLKFRKINKLLCWLLLITDY